MIDLDQNIHKPLISGSPEQFIKAFEATICLLQNCQKAFDEYVIVSVSDLAGTIAYVNDLLCSLSQYSEDKLIGQNYQLINSKFHPEIFSGYVANHYSGKVWLGVIRNRAKDGSYYWVKTTIFPFRITKEILFPK